MAVDTGSSDGTLEILLRRAQDEHRLVVIDGRGRNVPEALNLVLGNCTGKLLARVDAHGYVEREYLSCAVSALNSAPSNVACVGGRAIQEGRTVFGQAAALARQSRFGVGASQYAGRARAGPVETVNWGVYRRDAILAVGGFDPAMVEGEDEELNWRLIRSGRRILLDPSMRHHYVARDSFGSLFHQYRRYGRARVRVVRKHPDFLRPHHFIPATLVLGLTGLTMASVVSRVALGYLAGTVAAYLIAASGSGIRAAWPRLRLGMLVPSAFAALHLGYGVGSVQEVASYLRRSAAERHGGCGVQGHQSTAKRTSVLRSAEITSSTSRSVSLADRGSDSVR